MSKYRCRACEEVSELPFKGGVCSKCGSVNIANMERVYPRRQNRHITDPKKSFLMVLLWGFIIYEIMIRF